MCMWGRPWTLQAIDYSALALPFRLFRTSRTVQGESLGPFQVFAECAYSHGHAHSPTHVGAFQSLNRHLIP